MIYYSDKSYTYIQSSTKIYLYMLIRLSKIMFKLFVASIIKVNLIETDIAISKV